MIKIFACTFGLVLIGIAAGCGDEPCPEGYVVVDETCVPKSIASHCHFTGSSHAGESCASSEDCHGCFIVCLERVCVEQKLAGAECERDVECRSNQCVQQVCIQ